MSSQVRVALFTTLLVGIIAFGFAFLLALFGIQDTIGPLVVAMVAGVAIFTGLSRNRKIAQASAAERQLALAGPQPDQAQLFVIRQGFVGKFMGVDVFVDGTRRTQLLSPRFAALTLPPGMHSIEAEAAQAKRTGPLQVELNPGQVAVVDIKVGMGKLALALRTAPTDLATELANVSMVAD